MIKLIKKLNKKEKGSATVEAAMIFPLIMFVMFGIIYLTIVHYQNNVMIAESIRAMNRAGAYWQYIDMAMVQDGEKKKIDYVDYDGTNVVFPFDDRVPAEGIINFRTIAKRNAYRTIIDVISEGVSKISDKIQLTKKKSNATKYVKSRIANVKFKQYYNDNNNNENEIGNVEGRGFMFVGDDLSIKVGRAYINPIQNLAKVFFNSKDNNNFFLTKDMIDKKNLLVKSVISNQAEFIRNLDSIYDLGKTVYNIVAPSN